VVDGPRRMLVRHPVAVDAVVAVILSLVGASAVATAHPGPFHAVSTAVAAGSGYLESQIAVSVGNYDPE